MVVFGACKCGSHGLVGMTRNVSNDFGVQEGASAAAGKGITRRLFFSIYSSLVEARSKILADYLC